MSFQKQIIDFSETNLLDRLVQDYLDGNCGWLTGYEKKSAFDDVLNRRKSGNFPHRQLLVDVLKEQNKKLNALQQKNIEALLSTDTFTVTTGHQLNLFTGPLYFIYKIVTTINLAHKLNEKYPSQHFVPVYWMASEDHDIAEVNHTTVYGKGVEWKTAQTGAVGRMKCEGITEAINEIESLLGESENARHIVELLRESYSEYHSMAEATRMLVNELFAKYGLLILDADDKRLKKEFAMEMKDDLQNHSAFKLINQTIDQLKQKGYEAQVHPREINLFFLGEHTRERITKENKEANTSKILDADSLSPNVVLRTLYQETILPNIAYIGGAAEIAYWLEYRSTFDYYNVSYPVLVLRNSAMLVDESAFLKIKKLGFAPEDFFQTSDDLAKKFVLNNTNNFSFKEEASLITQAFNSLSQKVAGIDNTLKATAEAERQKNLNSLKALEEKVIRTEKKKHETAILQIQKLKEKLFPGGVPHERIDNFLPYYVKYGDGFIEMFKENLGEGENFVILTEAIG